MGEHETHEPESMKARLHETMDPRDQESLRVGERGMIT